MQDTRLRSILARIFRILCITREAHVGHGPVSGDTCGSTPETLNICHIGVFTLSDIQSRPYSSIHTHVCINCSIHEGSPVDPDTIQLYWDNTVQIQNTILLL